MNGRATELRRINPALAHSWGVVRSPAIDLGWNVDVAMVLPLYTKPVTG